MTYDYALANNAPLARPYSTNIASLPLSNLGTINDLRKRGGAILIE